MIDEQIKKYPDNIWMCTFKFIIQEQKKFKSGNIRIPEISKKKDWLFCYNRNHEFQINNLAKKLGIKTKRVEILAIKIIGSKIINYGRENGYSEFRNSKLF